MTEEQLHNYLCKHFPIEHEDCEWKEFKNLKNDLLGKAKNDAASYVSALANMEGGHLVIGIEDGTLNIIGTDLANYTKSNAKLKILEACTNLPSIGLEIDEFITSDTNKIVWIITVPKHSPRKPVIAHRTAYQRINDSLVELTSEREAEILSEQFVSDDWSAHIIADATIDDLDPHAIRTAREKYLEIHPHKEAELQTWDDETFLNKAKITIKGKITNAAIILLGREESEHFLSPSVCKIRWQLKDGHDMNKDFRIFTIPMIDAITDFMHAVRNVRYEYIQPGKMFPDTMMRYDGFTLREPLNNAIAHQDYAMGAMIEVVEYEDEKLVFKNYGQFIPASIANVINNDSPESCYRNPFLAEAMRNVHMVETEGGGIKKLFIEQKKRFFPMPDYDISGGKVVCEIQGKVLDKEFANILALNPDLMLADIMLLDQVQKHQPITNDALKYLRKQGFVEGNKRNLFLSSSVVKATGHSKLKADYIKNRGFDDEHFKGLILEYIAKWKSASRKEIEILLIDKLPDSLDYKRKKSKVGNLLTSLRVKKKIEQGEGRRWVLSTSLDGNF